MGFAVSVAGTQGYLVMASPFDSSWRANGVEPLPNLGLTNAFPLVPGNAAVTVRYQKIPWLFLAYLLSVATGGALAWTMNRKGRPKALI